MKDVNKYYLFYLPISIALGLVGLYSLWLGLQTQNERFYTVASILLAIILFFLNDFLKRHEHKLNQYRILETLQHDLEIVEHNQTNLSPLYPNIPYWLIHVIDISYYRQNLDRKIDGKETKPILNKLVDLSRHVAVMNFEITYLITNNNDKFYIEGEEAKKDPQEAKKDIECKMRELEEKRKLLKFDVPEFKEFSELLNKRNRAFMFIYIRENLYGHNNELKNKINEVREEIKKIIKNKN